MTTYLFHRAEGFYPIELENHAIARKNAECNPGTLKVDVAGTGEIVWRLPISGGPLTGAQMIAEERQRQIEVEKWSAEHDDNAHAAADLLSAGIAYAEAARHQALHGKRADMQHVRIMYWPWDKRWWKPCDPIRNLVKAGALIAAEIDRLQRAK